MRAFVIEEYRDDYGDVLLRLAVYAVQFRDEALFWDRLGAQWYPPFYYGPGGRGRWQRRKIHAYVRLRHKGFPTFVSGVRHAGKVTSSQARRVTGLTHPMAAVDKLRELVTEGISNDTQTGSFRAGG